MLPQESDDNQQPITEQEWDYIGPDGEKSQLDQHTIGLLESLAKKVSMRETWPRLVEIKKSAEQRNFYAGYQHIFWNNNAGVFQVGPNGASVASDQQAASRPRMRKSFNIYLGYAKSFMSVFSQASPGTRFEADDPKDETDKQDAAESDKMRQVIEKFNDPKMIQIDVARYLWTDGRAIAFTDWVVDEEEFGLDAEGDPQGQEVVKTFGTLETKIPLTAKTYRDISYCKISQEYALSELKAEYPFKAKQIKQGSKGYDTTDEVARNARIGIAEGTRWLGDDSLAHLATKDVYFFRPSEFWNFPEDDRKDLEEKFPDGVRVVFVGATYVQSRSDSMEDHIAILHAIPGDGQQRVSLGNPMVPIQIDFNDFMNLVSETAKYVVPATWVDEGGIDIDAFQEQVSSPGEHYTVEKGARNPGEPISNLFYTEEAAVFPDAFMKYMENLQGPLAQFITGQLPALFGGNMEDQKTARGYAQARDQALGLLALNWLPFKKFYSKIMEQAVRCAAKNRVEQDQISVQMQDDDEPLTVEMANLKGNSTCTPETDENFPESFTQKQSKFFSLVTLAATDPVVGAMINNPENSELFRSMSGLKDLKITGADSVEKTWKIIAQLRKATPVPDVEAIGQEVAQAQQTGTQVPLDPATMPQKASIDPDPEVDELPIHYKTCKDWLNSADGIKDQEDNPQGYMNVRLYMLKCKELIQMQAMQQAMAAMPPQLPPAPGAHPAPPPVQQPPAAPPAAVQ